MGQRSSCLLRRSLLVLIATFFLAPSSLLLAQASGLNVIIGFAHPLLKYEWGTGSSSGFGLGIHHDFDHHFGIRVDLMFAFPDNGTVGEAHEATYCAEYFLTDNHDATAVYVGSFIGVQHLKCFVIEYSGANQNGPGTRTSHPFSGTQVPIGIRTGVRGGLRGYFSELYVQAGYAFGSGEVYSSADTRISTVPFYFGIGISILGVGWDGKRR